MTVRAKNTQIVFARNVAVSVGGSVGKGGAIQVAVALVDNKLDGNVTAAVTGSTTKVSGAAVDVTAESNGDIDAISVGVAVAVSAATGSGPALSLAGSGAEAKNTFDDEIKAYVDGATVTARSGNVVVTALDKSPGRADAGAGSLAVAVSTGSGPGDRGRDRRQPRVEHDAEHRQGLRRQCGDRDCVRTRGAQRDLRPLPPRHGGAASRSASQSQWPSRSCPTRRSRSASPARVRASMSRTPLRTRWRHTSGEEHGHRHRNGRRSGHADGARLGE